MGIKTTLNYDLKRHGVKVVEGKRSVKTARLH